MNCVPFLNTRVHPRFTVLVVFFNLFCFLCTPLWITAWLFGIFLLHHPVVIAVSVSFRWRASYYTSWYIQRFWSDMKIRHSFKAISPVNVLFIIILWLRAEGKIAFYNTIVWFRFTKVDNMMLCSNLTIDSFLRHIYKF